ncbi:MAG: nucleoside 2-deoxyribosyltransferase domain-containing protein [Candidatus Stygibacter australis]|nr:nucleoside 2-deoxyribosyltransferase domain-containing protein [Candidatus Stygibacter australis]
MKIYFAGPLFNEAERSFNESLTIKLEEIGFEVFLPQRDGIEKERESLDKTRKDEKRKRMFKLDRDMILECDIFLFILDGRIPDEGACVELGIAYCQKFLTKSKKMLIGLQTDSRAAFIGSKLNPMLKVPLDYIMDSSDSLIAFLKLKAKN